MSLEHSDLHDICESVVPRGRMDFNFVDFCSIEAQFSSSD